MNEIKSAKAHIEMLIHDALCLYLVGGRTLVVIST